RARSPGHVERLGAVRVPECHPLFTVVPGPVEPWERVYDAAQKRTAARSGTAAARDESRPAGGPARPPAGARTRAGAARSSVAATDDASRDSEPSTARRLNRRR